jgi:hypothetical protein
MIKCSLRADSLTLRHGESPTTAHKMNWVIHKLRRMITKLPITTKPSRWWRSPRVTSKNSHLTTTSLMRRWMHTCYSLDTSEDSHTWILKTQISLGLLHFLAHERSFSADKMNKSTSNGGVEEVFKLPSTPLTVIFENSNFCDRQTRWRPPIDASVALEGRVWRLKGAHLSHVIESNRFTSR